jgi:S-DNA-T family DNA segregation ATPase FtsK/SpoIIIE
MTIASKDTFLPRGTSEFFWRRITEIFGFAILALALAYAISLISYSPGDPSFNNATPIAATNWLGAPGAYVADISLQTIGLGTFTLTVILFAWAWRLVSHQGLHWIWLKFATLPVSVILSATLAATFAAPANWPVTSGFGGFIGDLLHRQVLTFSQWIGVAENPLIHGATVAVLGLAVVLFTLGLSMGDWGRMLQRSWWLLTRAWRGLSWALRLTWRFITALGRRAQPVLKKRIEPRVFASRRVETEGEDLEPVREFDPRPKTRPRVAKRAPNLRTGRRAAAEAQTRLDLDPAEIQLPALSLLRAAETRGRSVNINEDALEQNARMLESVLDDFGVRGEITRVRPGPVVTLYELEPARGTKTSRVIGLADDIARSMSAVSVRVAVVPGRNAIGIELPNARIETVVLRELLSAPDYESSSNNLSLALGKDIGGASVIADLSRMPHLLVAGTTGSGKSVAINSMILSLLYQMRPDQCKLILIDPKMLELSVYDDIPHLLTPVVTEPAKAVFALKWAVREMETRYRAMSRLGVRNIASYNQRLEKALRKGETLKRTVQTGFDAESGDPVFEDQPFDLAPMPYIVVVVDELADLMLLAGKEIEASVQRLSQMARAAGIHLIMATQRPSVDVITGTIKANFPTRISFQVTSKIDSRTILGESGAEQLLGSGDMLFMQSGGRLMRVHGPFVSEHEVERVVNFLRRQGAPNYLEEVTEEPDAPLGSSGGGLDDALYDQAVDLVCREGKASTSFVQRHLQIGYNRAARIIERMEAEGVVSSANHVGKREVLARRTGELA